MALARSGRQPSRGVLDERHRRAADRGAGRRRRRPVAPRRPDPSIDAVLSASAQRPQRAGQRRRARARRLPRDRRARDPGRHGVPARAPAAARAPGDHDARRPGAAPCPPAGARRPRRGPSGRPAFHAGRGGGLPQRRDGPRTDRDGDVADARGPDRRLDRRPAAGRAVDAGPRRRRRASSTSSPGTTATSSTTSSKRSGTVNPTTSSSSCCRPRSWPG